MFAAMAAVALAGAACAANGAPPNVRVQEGGGLVAQVVDSLNDAGRAPSVAVDKDGNPAVAYILLSAPLKKGQIPPPVIAGQPQPPAVILAIHTQGAWLRFSVTKQSLAPAKGEAEGLTFKDGSPVPGLHTAVAVDGQGNHHVAWDSAAGLFYSEDSSGTFGDPQKVVDGQTFGVSLAVGPAGDPVIAFYRGSSVEVARRSGTSWVTQSVASLRGAGGADGRATAIQIGKDGTTFVAFGDGSSTEVASRSGSGKGSWSTATVSGPGGFGVSLALDGDGKGHVAYYDSGGGVHLATGSGSSWQVADVASTAPATGGGGDARWTTGTGVDGKGGEYVTWADTKQNRVQLASGQGGQLATVPVPDSLAGVTPSLAVGSDPASLALAWYDSANGNLQVATPAASGLALAFSPPPQPTGTPAPAPSASCSPNGTTIKVVAKGIAFDTNCLAAPAGKSFTVDFDNQDPATPHNVDIYSASPASGGKHLGGAKDASDVVLGVATATYQVSPLKKGTYFFQCDIHPANMFGTFVVA